MQALFCYTLALCLKTLREVQAQVYTNRQNRTTGVHAAKKQNVYLSLQ